MSKKYKIGMVAAEFNFEVTSLMIQRAEAEAEFLDVEISRRIMVPGVFDMPLAIKTLLKDPEIDAVITLGGVTGPGMTELQAMDRIEKGRDVVDVVVKMLKRLEGQ